MMKSMTTLGTTALLQIEGGAPNCGPSAFDLLRFLLSGGKIWV